MKPQQIFALHYLFVKKSATLVVAHCLDLDLVVTATDEKEAERRLNMVVKAQFAQAFKTGSLILSPAPPQMWAELKHAHSLPPATLKIETPPMMVAVQQAIIAEMPILRSEIPVAA